MILVLAPVPWIWNWGLGLGLYNFSMEALGAECLIDSDKKKTRDQATEWIGWVGLDRAGPIPGD